MLHRVPEEAPRVSRKELEPILVVVLKPVIIVGRGGKIKLNPPNLVKFGRVDNPPIY